MYALSDAGGIPYPETEKYHYDRWYTTTGLTDGSAYKTIRFNVRQDNRLLHWKNSYLEMHGQVVKEDGDAFANGALIAFIHNAVPHVFSNVKLTVGGQQIENPDTQRHVEVHEIHETDDRTVQIKLYSREPAGHLNRIVIGNLRDKVVEITKDVPQNNA